MRLIGHFDNEAQALRLSGVLLAQGIHHQVEADHDPAPVWGLWVHAEEDLERAGRILAAFRANPEDPRFRLTGGGGGVRDGGAGGGRSGTPAGGGRAGAGAPGRRRARPVDPETASPGTITLLIIAACAGVAIVTQLRGDGPGVRALQISEVWFRLGSSMDRFLPEVRSGQIWRLFTPALLHFGWPHILFNLWTFWDLGRAIEQRRGPGTLIGLVVGLGVISNLGQYLAAGPHFGGLSGAIYGLLGYIWMLGRHRPEAGLGLHPQMVFMMLFWFVLCLVGAMGPHIANMAHAVGLVAGMWWGKLAARAET